MPEPSAVSIASTIEHTLLKPEATASDVQVICDEAVALSFRAVCVNPHHVCTAVKHLSPTPGSPFVVSVAGFPLGASRSQTKADEARRALDDGATEIDMVVLLPALIDGESAAARRDVEAVARVVHQCGAGLKVILETAALTHQQIILGCRVCAEAQADFVKTSTGFHPSGGATLEHVRLLHRYASPMGVKASGGIRTAETAVAMIEAGASRLGTSSGVAILKQLGQTSG